MRKPSNAKKTFRHVRNKVIDYHWIYEFLHAKHPKYGGNPTREFEFTIMTQRLQFNHILDVGCGNGQLLKWLQKSNPTAKLHGCDIAQAALDKVKLDNVDLKLSKAQSLDFPDVEFDLVTCMDVLEHVDSTDIPQAIKELHRVSKSHVLIQTDDADCLEDKYLVDTEYDGLELHAKRAKLWWEANITKTGLKILKRQNFGTKMTFLCTI